MKGKLIIVHRKDYTIESDGKKYTCKGDIYIGTMHPNNSREFFKGAFFSKYRNQYELIGDVQLSKKEFDEVVESWHEIN